MKFGVDGSVFFGLSPNYFQGVCGLGGEGMRVDGSVDMEELRKHYEWIDKKNEVGKEEVHIHFILLPVLVEGTSVRHQSRTREQMVAVW